MLCIGCLYEENEEEDDEDEGTGMGTAGDARMLGCGRDGAMVILVRTGTVTRRRPLLIRVSKVV
jgi:hypothetical protein